MKNQFRHERSQLKKAEGGKAPAEAEKPNGKTAAKPEQGDAKKDTKETKPAAPEGLVRYVKSVRERHNLPGNVLEKLRKCTTKGEAKRELKTYLQSVA